MGCGRIVTTQDIQQIREARKGVEAGSVVVASGHVGTGLKMIIISYKKIEKVWADIGERAAERTREGHNLNYTVRHNSKIYDVGSNEGVSSVKTRGVFQGSISRQTVNNYVGDLRVATGRSQILDNIKKFNAAAQELRQAARQDNVSLPSALKNAQSDKVASDWLRGNAKMDIPDDQVPQVRSAVKRSVMLHPETWGLPSDASYRVKADLAKELAGRVQPMGKEIAEIERLLAKHL